MPSALSSLRRLRGSARTTQEGATIATIDELLAKVDSKYTLVHLSARRAREINSYYHSLGEGLGQFTPPLVDSTSNKPLSIALEEIAAEKIVVQNPGDALRVAEELLGSEGVADAGGAHVVELGVDAGAADTEAPDADATADETPDEDAAADGDTDDDS